MTSIPVVIDARKARPVQKTLMHSRTLWNRIRGILVIPITNEGEMFAFIPGHAEKQFALLYQQHELQLIDAGK